jgi:nucleotide-binding universal stress UspA family protein
VTNDANHQPLLICYDSSDGSRAALDAAAALFAGREAIVACFWQPFAESSTRLRVNILELVQNADAINAREEEGARAIAEEGAEIAREAGLMAEGHAIKIHTAIDEAILVHAEETDAAAIVLGSRSHTGLRSLILGDIANEVVQRATRPVVIAPSKDLARRRRQAEAEGARV